MRLTALVLASVASVALATFPLPASAGEGDLFIGVDVSGGLAGGTSGTTNGGAPFAGGGVVRDVNFGKTLGIGGHVGYRLDPAMSVFISYQHIRGDIRWSADFPQIGASSGFEGSATSNAIMGNAGYEFSLSDTTTVGATAGLGITFNTLSGLDETDNATGIFLADVAGHTTINPAARIGIGIRQQIMPYAALGLDASVAYFGGFKTGDSRSGNLGVTDINPYTFKNVWRATLAASLRFEF